LKKTLISLLLVSVILISSIFIGGVFAAPAEKIPVIVGFKELPEAALIHAHGGDIAYEYSIINAIACSLPPQAVTALQKNPKIAYIEEDIQVSAAALELDNSWGVKHIGAGTVHDLGNEGAGVKVAVLDTGINYNHEELSASFGGAYKGGVDIINNDADPFDDNGHGTHCAGIIAAAHNNNDVVVGVAPQVSLYSVKVLNSAGSGSTSTIIAGIQWAVDNHMQIISMSLGSSTGTTSLQTACDNAYNHGVLLVAASGNDYKSSINYPARYDSVVAVGATDSLDKRAGFSNYGTGLELMAPGVNILSTYKDVSPNDNRNIDVVYMSGTSMATPHVAGVAALVFASPIDQIYELDHDGVWDASEVRTKLQSTASDLGASGKDIQYGYGLVDAVKATTGSVDNAPPTISNITPSDGAIINTAAPTISATVIDASGIGLIQMQLDGGNVIPAITGATVSYQTTGLSEGTHPVSLTAADTLGNTSPTKTWVFTIDTTPPTQVTDLAVNSATTTSINLGWTTVSGAVKYNVYRDGLKVGTPTANSFSDTGLTPSTSYIYTVSAVDSAGNLGIASGSVAAKTNDAQQMHVSNIVMALKTSGFNTFATATIKIVDTGNNPISGATVTGKWSIATQDSDTANTNSAGTVVVQSNNVRNAQRGTTFTFTVTAVTLTGYSFSPSSADTNTIKK
jgi:subtilisin